MAFLAPLAGGAVAKTAGAAALAKAAGAATVAGGASTALGAGLTAGTALGSGAMAAMPALSYAGANLAAPGILGALPSAVAPTAGIFAKAAPALGGLKAGTTIPGLASTAPGATGLKSLAMKSPFSAINQATGMGNLGTQSANLAPKFVKASTTAGDVAGGTNYLTGGLPVEVAPIEIQQAANLSNAVKSGGLRMPTGMETGLRLTPEVTQSAMLPPGSTIQPGQNFLQNAANFFKNPSLDAAGDYVKEHPYASAAGAYGLYSLMQPKPKAREQDKGMIRPYEFAYNPNTGAYDTSPVADTSERMYFNPTFTELEPYKAAEGGLMGLAVGGPVETMSAMNAVGGNLMYPQAGLQTALYSNPMMQRPEAVNIISPSGDAGVGSYTGEAKFASGGDTKDPKIEGQYKYSYDPKTFVMTQLSAPRYADTTLKNLPPLNTGSKTAGGIAPPVGGPGIAALMPQTQAAPINIPAYQSPEEQLGLSDFYTMMNRRLAAMGGYAAGGGVSDLGGYSDGGRLLKGPGDGVSDSIPAVIGERQPARLADGEFVVPARIVSELGNGSTEAGARKLYAMMDRVQKARRRTVGKDRVAANTKADKYLPA